MRFAAAFSSVGRWSVVLAAVTGFGLGSADLLAVTPITSVKFAALDQPRINIGLLRNPTDQVPLGQNLGFGFIRQSFEAFLDTGASGLLISAETADGFGLQLTEFNGVPVIFSDVGVGGSTDFRVSETVTVAFRRYNQPLEWFFLNPEDFQSDFPGREPNVRLQVGPFPIPDNPLLADLNVFGMPIIRNRVIVMDGRPVNAANVSTGEGGVMNTYLYNAGTPFRPDSLDEDPGIVPTVKKVKMSKASFDRFTTLTPAGAPGPTLADNPFIGPSPTRGPGVVDTTPGVKVTLGNRSVVGSFLFDTGASVSFLSTRLARQIGVRYVEGTLDVDGVLPQIEVFDPANPSAPGVTVPSFWLDIGGIGGTVRRAGIYFDSLLLTATDGIPYDPTDPRNVLFARGDDAFPFEAGAPLLIADITVVDASLPEGHPDRVITLDGIFGMNYLVASVEVFFPPAGGIPVFGEIGRSAYPFTVYDDTDATLGFSYGVVVVPEPAAGGVALITAGLLLTRRPRA